MRLARILTALLLFAGCFGPSARGQDDDVLAEDAVAYLLALRDTAIFDRTATIRLDYRAIVDLGIADELYKIGPGAFIARMKDGKGFFGFSIRRVDRCRFEERYTLAGRSNSQSSRSSLANNPDRVYDFSKASFDVVPDDTFSESMGRRWMLEVKGESVFSMGNLLVNTTRLHDITATPDDAMPERKGEELKRVIALFQQKFCPGGTG